MRRYAQIAAAGAATGAAVLAAQELLARRREHHIDETLLRTSGPRLAFDPARLASLPPPARRYLVHAIAPGTPCPAFVTLRQSGKMFPRAAGGPLHLVAAETLRPHTGFIWRARATMAGMPLTITDRYLADDAAITARLGGVVPVMRQRGPDITRSTRHRIVMESVWNPAALLPGPAVRWVDIDDQRARVTVTLDGEDVPFEILVDEEGRLVEVSMWRHGNAGTPSWGPIPYGFAVAEEGTFEGMTIPTTLSGGWWYGTLRHDRERASVFVVEDARYG